MNDKQTNLKAAWFSFMSNHLFSPSAKKTGNPIKFLNSEIDDRHLEIHYFAIQNS